MAVGGAVIGWFAAGAMLKVLTKYLLANPAVAAKIPKILLWFLGMGGAKGAIGNQLFQRYSEHIFSKSHVNNGLMKLGSSRRDIFNKGFNIMSSKIQQAANGSNEIRTYIKGLM